MGGTHRPGQADNLKETALLPDFLGDFFGELLGYTRPTDGAESYTLSREQHVEDDGKFADAVLGRFHDGSEQFIVALEGKGTRDPLDRPFAGRKMSAVDQAYRYAINLPCDWIIVTSMRETRLYHKGSNQHTYERFETVRLANEPALLKRFVFLLGAERVVPAKRDCHLYDLLKASEAVGRELTNQFYALYAGIRAQVLNRLCHDNPAIDPPEILRCTQKLLDRVLFCAFCEDRGLLPGETLKRAFEHSDPYNPKPIWDNFRGLFRAIDTGNAGLNIPAYNGGLFAHDPGLDNLAVADEVCAHFKELGDYEYRPARELADQDEDTVVRSIIDVDILGHIFEQSITDLERLKQELEATNGAAGKATFLSPQPGPGDTNVAPPVQGEGPPGSSSLAPIGGEGRGEGASNNVDEKKARSRRKKEGAFYTPAFITRYIVEQALGGVLKQSFETLRQRHEAEATGTAPKALIDPNAYDLATLNEPQRKALIRFWEAWQDELKTIRILDPACGSGAFLIEAFDQLYAVFEISNARLEELRAEGMRTLFDLDRQILQNNLYGVDLNPEAIQICQLSLWIKTAARGKQLTSLDHTIREGNSVVSDPSVHPRALDWQAAFPEVFQQGGFDVVIGNPPYIRQEWLAPFKPYWETRYQSYHGVADIFTYFFEQGLKVLRPGGRLAFITSGSWVRGNFGAPLRKFLSSHAKMESMVDFGEFQPFEDAEMIRPSITILSKGEPGGEMRLFKWLTTGRPPETLSEEISIAPMVRSKRFGEVAWELESDDAILLREKLASHGCALSTLAGKPILMGIKPGTTAAFIVDAVARAALIAEDPSCETLFLPFTRGQDIRPWHVEDSGLWAISLCSSDQREWPWTSAGDRAEKIFAHTYPSLHRHMVRFEAQLKGRMDNIRFWWELRSCAYWHQIFVPRIEWPDITNRPRFTVTGSGGVIGDTAFIIPGEDYFLLGILASWPTWFFISKTAQPLRLRSDRWQYRLKAQYMEHIPIPDTPIDERQAIAQLAQSCCSLGQERYVGQVAFQRRLVQSFGGDSDGKLNQKAEAWWELSLNQLGDALKTSFKLSANPMKKPQTADEWEPYLKQKQTDNASLTRRLADAEAELNDRVYRLFNLTPEEIKLLQKEVEH